jgi:hypothetical protein
VRENGGRVYRVRRGNEPAWYSTAESYNVMTNWDGSIQQMKNYPDVHFSEWAWIGKTMDGEIRNEGTLADLERKLDSIVAL